MRVIKGLAVLVGLVAAGVLAGGLLLPSEHRVERSLRVDAPPDVVWRVVDDVRTHADWNPWKAADPTMVITAHDPPRGVGAKYTWTSEASGSGSYTITKSVRGERVESTVDFGPMGVSQGWLAMTPDGDGTMVTWGFEGETKGVLAGWWALLMDSFVGPAFEDGLRRLEPIVEEAARKQPATPLEGLMRGLQEAANSLQRAGEAAAGALEKAADAADEAGRKAAESLEKASQELE